MTKRPYLVWMIPAVGLAVLLFTVVVAAQVVGTGNISMSGNVSTQPPSAGTYFEDDFELGDLSKWSGTEINADPATVNVNSNQVHSGTKSCDMWWGGSGEACPYILTSDFDTPIADGLEEFYARAYFYIPTPEAGASCTTYHHRKLLYFVNLTEQNWLVLLDTWYYANAGQDPCPDNGSSYVQFMWNYWYTGKPGGPTEVYFPSSSPWSGQLRNGWHSIEVYVKANTPGSSDGELNAWLDGTAMTGAHLTGVNMRGDFTQGLIRLRFGDQVAAETVDEHRYLDDVKISSSYIGP